MNRDLVDKVVNAVLYEGYILYPYRASSKKNQRERFTLGRVYPKDYSDAQSGAEPFVMQTECLVRNESRDAALEISVRFLQPYAREIGRLSGSLNKLTDDTPFEIVPELRVGNQLYQTWQEAVEREVSLPVVSLNEATNLEQAFEFPATRAAEPIRDGPKIAGVILRRNESINGRIELTTRPIDAKVMKITARVNNETKIDSDNIENQSEVIMRTFASAHTILHARGGEFISLLDPVPKHEAEAKKCRNIGCWPVLVGEEEKHQRDTMLSSPIILYDYPKIAAESAGDLFDSTEIDEILTLRVKTMTDAEKAEMRNVDEQARRILERSENMTADHLMQMHGTMRHVRSINEDFFNPAKQIKSANVQGVDLKKGDRVRIRPKKRADVMDIALDGKIAIIEAVERDVEDQVHFALILEDDPGKDLGFMRQPGHRFFYGADEVDPIGQG
jgi:hydrogenase maturation protease